MTGPSIAKDFHRMMKRIGRLTDGQATIDNVDWDSGALNSFNVTIRPNSGHYKDGRFNFTVDVPEDFITGGEPPSVWCNTDVYHPNIDRTETRTERFTTNVCLNILEHGSWNSAYGLEGIVLGILFMMHNPNYEDPLSPEFDGGSLSAEDFADNVKDYMEGNTVDGVYEYCTDFQVIDGVFYEVQQAQIENKSVAEPESNDENAKSEDVKTDETDTTEGNENTVNNETNITQNDIPTETMTENTEQTSTVNETVSDTDAVPNPTNDIGNQNTQNDGVNSEQDDKANVSHSTDTTNISVNVMDELEDSDDDEEILPIKFVEDEENDGYYVIDFGGYVEHPSDKNSNCDNTSNSNINDNTTAVINATVSDEMNDKFGGNLGEARERAKSITNLNELQGKPVLARSVSVPCDFQMKAIVKHKPTKTDDDMCMKALACVALDCLLTVFKNML